MRRDQMRSAKVGLLGMLLVGLSTALALAQQGGGGQAGRGGGRGAAAGAGGGLVSMPVLQPEPTDNAAIFTKADLEKKYGQMEAAKAGAWRIVDGGTRTVNIRIGTNDAPQVHPNTVE